MIQALSFVMAMALAGALPARAADSPVGAWNTVDEKSGKAQSTVEVYERGGKITALGEMTTRLRAEPRGPARSDRGRYCLR